jgi:protein TonB
MMPTTAYSASGAFWRTEAVRSGVAVIVTLALNLFIALGLALWQGREQATADAAPEPPVVLMTVEPDLPAPLEHTPEPDTARQEPVQIAEPRPRPVEMDLPAPAMSPSDALPPVAAAPGSLSAWSPRLEYAVEAPVAAPEPGVPGGAGTGEPADAAPARPQGVSRGPLLLEPPPLGDFYPRMAQRQRITGVTWLRLRVDAEGRVTEATVLQSTPGDVFDSAARRVARRMRYQPALRNGRPVPARVRIKLVWRPE